MPHRSNLRRFLALYLRHFRDQRRERMFLASLSFFVTFVAVRLVTHLSRGSEAPIQVVIGGVHVHHLVWGIALLILVGYVWLIQADHATNGESSRMGRLTAMLYGAGAALTLDEFALWLRLDDVYWERAGRASIEVGGCFGALVSAGLWGGPFLRAVARHARRLLRAAPPAPPLEPTPLLPAEALVSSESSPNAGAAP